MNVTIDYLEVWQAPIGEQIRPRRFPVFAPHPKQRDAVVNFGALPPPSAALAAAPRLQPPQEPDVVTWRVPKLPRDHTGAVPVRIHVGTAIPQIDMPTEAIDRLAAHAAESRTLRICAFAIGRGWRSICGRQSMVAVIAELPALRSEEPAHVPANRRGWDGRANTNLLRAAAWAAQRGGRGPKTDPRMERCVAMPYRGERETDDFFLPSPLAIWTSSAPGPDSMVPSSRKTFVTKR